MPCKEMTNPHIVWACVVVYCWTTLMLVVLKKKVDVTVEKAVNVEAE